MLGPGASNTMTKALLLLFSSSSSTTSIQPAKGKADARVQNLGSDDRLNSKFQLFGTRRCCHNFEKSLRRAGGPLLSSFFSLEPFLCNPPFLLSLSLLAAFLHCQGGFSLIGGGNNNSNNNNKSRDEWQGLCEWRKKCKQRELRDPFICDEKATEFETFHFISTSSQVLGTETLPSTYIGTTPFKIWKSAIRTVLIHNQCLFRHTDSPQSGKTPSSPSKRSLFSNCQDCCLARDPEPSPPGTTSPPPSTGSRRPRGSGRKGPTSWREWR